MKRSAKYNPETGAAMSTYSPVVPDMQVAGDQGHTVVVTTSATLRSTSGWATVYGYDACSQSLSDLYTTQALIGLVQSDMPAFTGSLTPASQTASYELSADESSFALRKMQYRFVSTGSQTVSLNWLIVFQPDDTTQPILTKAMTWTGVASSFPLMTVDPTTQKYDNGSPGPKQKGNGTITLLPIQITDVISDQISGNEANKLPDGKPFSFTDSTGTHRDTNNPMLMAARSGTTANIAVKVTAPQFALSKILVAVRKVHPDSQKQDDGTGAILGSTPAVQGPAKTLVQFDAEAFHATDYTDISNLYSVVAGYDANGDGVLTKNEIAVTFSATDGTSTPPHDEIRVVTKGYFDAQSTVLEDDANAPFGTGLGTGVAGDLLRHFITGSTVPGATATTFTLTSTYSGLSHPLGANWSSSNSATADFFTFAVGTSTSSLVRDSNLVAQCIDKTIEAHKSDIATYFTSHPTETHYTTSYSFGPGNSADFNITDPGTFFSVLGGAFGKVTISGSFTVTCTKISGTNKFTADTVDYTGNFDDLYDFDYRGGGLALPASCVEAGYATLSTATRPSGKVFKDHVDFQITGKALGKTYDAGP